jgi:hypothetical protein
VDTGNTCSHLNCYRHGRNYITCSPFISMTDSLDVLIEKTYIREEELREYPYTYIDQYLKNGGTVHRDILDCMCAKCEQNNNDAYDVERDMF